MNALPLAMTFCYINTTLVPLSIDDRDMNLKQICYFVFVTKLNII